MWLQFTWQQGFVLVMLIGIIIALITTRIKPSFIFVSAVFIAFIVGMLDLKQLTTNFTNSSLLTLVLLLVVSTALEKTRLMGWISHYISRGKLGTVVAKLTLSTAFISSFTNNTAVVVALISAIKRNQHHAPSRLLIPLSYSAILGGTLTLVGTSTNLVLNSFVVDAGLPSLGFFTPSILGLIVLCGGVALLIPMSYLLPNHEADEQEVLPYFLEARVSPDSSLVGNSVTKNNLRALRKLFLAEVIRDGKTITSIDPDFVIEANDRLLFCGDIDSVATIQEIKGLTLFGQHHLNGQHFVEVIVSSSGSLCNKTLKSSQFRERFGAVVVAIRRGHERLAGGLGNITLAAGDTLVLVPNPHFEQEIARHSREFVLINNIDSSAKLDNRNSILVLLGFAAVITTSILGWVPIIKGLLIYLVFIVVIRAAKLSELSRRFPLDIIVIVGSALSIAQLMLSTGLSQNLSDAFISQFHQWGVMGALVATYLLTLLLTELITNNAAAALAFPIGYSLAVGYHADPMPFIMAVLFGASASFISPYGYQTNLLVYSVGQYRLKDYIIMGLPMSIVYSALVLLFIPYLFPFYR